MLQSQKRILQYPKYFCIPSFHDGRIKSFETCMDLRAWSLDEREQSNYLLDVIKNDSFQYFGHVSLCDKIIEKLHYKENESSIMEEISLKENVKQNYSNLESDNDTFLSLRHSTVKSCFSSFFIASLSDECTEDYLSTQSIAAHNEKKEEYYTDFSICDDSFIKLTRRETLEIICYEDNYGVQNSNQTNEGTSSSKIYELQDEICSSFNHTRQSKLFSEIETQEIGIQVNVYSVEDVDMVNDQTNSKICKSECLVIPTEAPHDKNNLHNQNSVRESFDDIDVSIAEHYLTDDDIINMHENLKAEIKQQLNEVVRMYEQLQEKLFVNHTELNTTKRELEDIKAERFSLVKENQIMTYMFCKIQKQLHNMKQEHSQRNVETNLWNHESPNCENDELTDLSFENKISTVNDIESSFGKTTQLEDCRTSNFQMMYLNHSTLSSHVIIEDHSIQNMFPIIQQHSNDNLTRESIISQLTIHDTQTRSNISISDNYTPCKASSEDEEIVISTFESGEQDIIKVGIVETSEIIIEPSNIFDKRFKQIKSTTMTKDCKTKCISGCSKITLKRSLHKINSHVEYNRASPTTSSNSISKKEIINHPKDHNSKPNKQIDKFGKVRKNLALTREGTNITIQYEDPTRAHDVQHQRQHDQLERRQTSPRINMTPVQRDSINFEVFNCSLTVRLSN